MVVVGWKAGLELPTMSKIDHMWKEVSVRLLLLWGSDRKEEKYQGLAVAESLPYKPC